MKKYKSLLFTAIISLASTQLFAQANLPQASPAASVIQTFGTTKVDIEYHCPGVKGRTIWGNPKMVPYDSVWRTGANEATTISFSTDVMVGGQKIKSGKYALFTIPGRDTWTVILNSDADQWGAYGYNKSKDVVRFTVKPETADMKEKLSFYIDALTDSTARIVLRWEKVKVGFDVSAKTIAMMQKSIDGNWYSLASAANYYVDNNLDLNKAQQWAQASIAMNDGFYNRYVMARVLKAKGDNKEALKYAEESKKIGDTTKDGGLYDEYKDQVAKLITDLGGAKK